MALIVVAHGMPVAQWLSGRLRAVIDGLSIIDCDTTSRHYGEERTVLPEPFNTPQLHAILVSCCIRTFCHFSYPRTINFFLSVSTACMTKKHQIT